LDGDQEEESHERHARHSRRAQTSFGHVELDGASAALCLVYLEDIPRVIGFTLHFYLWCVPHVG
jgi:hypothetical protein